MAAAWRSATPVPASRKPSCRSCSTASSAARTWRDARASGSGLGLAIARSIVEMHDGRIEAASASGRAPSSRLICRRSEAVPAPKVHETSRAPCRLAQSCGASRWSPPARVATREAKHHDRRESSHSANGRRADRAGRGAAVRTAADAGRPSPYSATRQTVAAWSTRPPVSLRTCCRRGPPSVGAWPGGGVVALAVVAGIISGWLSAAAVTTLRPTRTARRRARRRSAPTFAGEHRRVLGGDHCHQQAPCRRSSRSQSPTATGGRRRHRLHLQLHGWILTNKHVVDGADALKVQPQRQPGASTATVYGIDPLTDLAIVKIDGSGPADGSIGSSADLERGQLAIAMGIPLGTSIRTRSRPA